MHVLGNSAKDKPRPFTRDTMPARNPNLVSPKSQSSKTLARTFESVLTKNDESGLLRPLARYTNAPPPKGMILNASGSNVTFEPNQKYSHKLGDPKKSHQNSDISTDIHHILPNSIYKQKNGVDDATFIRENLILAVGDQSSRTPRSPRNEDALP